MVPTTETLVTLAKKGIMVMVVTKAVINVCRFISTTPLTFASFEPNLNFLSRFE
jgi:hypothetical protein